MWLKWNHRWQGSPQFLQTLCHHITKEASSSGFCLYWADCVCVCPWTFTHYCLDVCISSSVGKQVAFFFFFFWIPLRKFRCLHGWNKRRTWSTRASWEVWLQLHRWPSLWWFFFQRKLSQSSSGKTEFAPGHFKRMAEIVCENVKIHLTIET